MRTKYISVQILLIMLTMIAFRMPVKANSTMIYVDPQYTDPEVYHIFEINISISQVTNLTGWDVKLYWDSQCVRGLSISEGPFLGTAGSTSFIVFEFANSYNATHGRLWAACSLQGPGSGSSGNGTLTTVTFNATCTGEADLTLADTYLVDAKMPPEYIPHTTRDGKVQIGTSDVAVTSVIPSKSIVGKGYGLMMNVTAENQGDYTVTFNVTLEASRLDVGLVDISLFGRADQGWGLTAGNITSPGPTIVIKKGDVVSLTLTSVDMVKHDFFVDYDGDKIPDLDEPKSPDFPGPPGYVPTIIYVFDADRLGSFTYYCEYHNQTMYGTLIVQEPPVLKREIGRQLVTLNSFTAVNLTFCWDTTTYLYANYTLSAVADIVPGEKETSNNLWVDGKVYVRIPGDLNADGTVDSTDLGTLGSSWGAGIGDLNYDPVSDINDDGAIDSTDLGIMGSHWGESL